MKVEKKEIPEEMKNTIIEVSNKSKDEKDSLILLKEIKSEELARKKDNKRATLFVNLVYLMGLTLSVIMMLGGEMVYALPALIFVTLGAFVFNLFIYNESKRTNRHIKSINDFYPTNGN
jgi:Flp pilus assembly protein TadB